MPQLRTVLARAVTAAERALDWRVGDHLRRRPGWGLTVVPYVGHGTPNRMQVRARVVARRLAPRQHAGPTAVLLTGLGHYLSAEVAREAVEISVAGAHCTVTSDPEGYVDATLDAAGLAGGWHQVTFGLAGESVAGRLLVVGPEARLGIVSDIDDTIIHTGLTRLFEAIRTTLLVAEEQRLPIPGAAELYTSLVAGDAGRAPVFYVSTGAWNLHEVLQRFLVKRGFPVGPMLMTDWGPGGTWLFREDSVAFKSRMILSLMDEHPQLRWVLVGDSGQHDPEAYAVTARARPGRLHAVYIREVPPQTPRRSKRVREVATELSTLGVPMLLVRDSIEAAEHAQSLGLLDAGQVAHIRAASG